jgi:hypothetical protein
MFQIMKRDVVVLSVIDIEEKRESTGLFLTNPVSLTAKKSATRATTAIIAPIAPFLIFGSSLAKSAINTAEISTPPIKPRIAPRVAVK